VVTLSPAAQVTQPPAPASAALEGVDDPGPDIVDEWGLQSFPASDPPSNW
jgi:hypothetical protein